MDMAEILLFVLAFMLGFIIITIYRWRQAAKWIQEVYWHYHHLENLKTTRNQWQRYQRNIKALEVPKSPKKARLHDTKIREVAKDLDNLEWERTEYKKQLDQLLEDGPP